MRVGGLITTFVLLVAAPTALAQTSDGALTRLQKSIACGPPVSGVGAAPDAIRIIGSQTAEPRGLNGGGDPLVLSGGTARGVTLGQQYFVRQVSTYTTFAGELQHAIMTSGWIRIVAVNDTTAIASVVHACGPIMAGDYLEPFVSPAPPLNAEGVDTSGQLDFTAPARVLYGGNDAHGTVGKGDFVVIDQGSNQGIAAGHRFAFYRDPNTPGLPLVAIGEAVAVSVGPAMALVRVNAANTEVKTNDYVVPRK